MGSGENGRNSVLLLAPLAHVKIKGQWLIYIDHGNAPELGVAQRLSTITPPRLS